MIRGDTWQELAANIDERLAMLEDRIGHVRLHEDFDTNLRATVTSFNEFAEAGEDQDRHS